ncbi:MAG TPA: hypothetical protein VID48_13790 [Solirubrobacteraceae bacterium]
MTLGVIVAALVAKALDRAEDRVVEDGEGVLRRVVGALRERFSRADDQVAAAALGRVEDAPDSPRRVREFAKLLDERAADDEVFRGELQELVEQARTAGVDIGSIVQVAVGDQNVQVAGLVDSEVDVSFGARPGHGRAPRSED